MNTIVSSQADKDQKLKKLTSKEFLSASNLTTDTVLLRKVYSPLLDHEITVHVGFSQFNNNRELSDFALRSLNEFLRLDNSNIAWFKAGLWRSCNASFQNSSYGLTGVPRKEGQSEYEANKDFFEIHNQDDAFSRSISKYLFIDNNNSGQSESCFLEYETPWDIEHNVIFIFLNGRQHAVE